ncbi:MAG TPA: hypothetical protein VGF58_06300 [Burkholderiales bacterium]|jgi:hypothetical protein
MLRSITAILLSALYSFAFAQDARPPRHVNLNAPGAMEGIKATSPAHYDAIQAIVAGLARNPHTADPRWIQTSFHARDVSYGMALLTSYPPKKNIAFTLDETRYEGRMTLESGSASFVPTR